MNLIKGLVLAVGIACLGTGAYQGLNLGGIIGDYPPPLSGIIGGLAPLGFGMLGTLCLTFGFSRRPNLEYIPRHEDPFDD